MATKYCDHGAYGAGSVVGSTSGSSTTLVVESVSSGIVGIGSVLSGAGITPGTVITGFVSGTHGGVGSYTMSAAMTISSGTAISCKHASPLKTPLTWALPQEGDGSTTTGATASAVISLDMSTWTFVSGSSSFSVMGGTSFSVGAGANSATVCQYSATLTTMIDNIVACINTYGTNATVNFPEGWYAHKINNAVFARRTGNTLEIMTRSGSAAWNGLIGVTFTNVTNAANGVWAGGSGGCWGWIANDISNFLPSSIGVFGYGLWTPLGPLAGKLSPGDNIILRSAKEIYYSAAGTGTRPTAGTNGGTLAAPVIFTVDDSTVWADGSNPQIVFLFSPSHYGPGIIIGGAGVYNQLIAKKYNSTLYGVKIRIAGTVGHANAWPCILSCLGGSVVEGVELDTTETTTYNHAAYVETRGESTYYPGVIKHFRVATKSSVALAKISNTYDASLLLVNGSFAASYAAAHPGVISMDQTYARKQVVFDQCQFTGFVANSNLYNGALTNSDGQRIILRNCDFGNVSVRGPYVSGQPATFLGGDPYVKHVSSYSQYGARDFSVDAPSGTVEWNSSRSYPTLNASRLDGGGAWSILATPAVSSTYCHATFPLMVPRIGKINTLAAGSRTATVHIAVHENLSFSKASIAARFEYIDTSGKYCVVDTYDPLGAALTSDAGSVWSSEASGKVYYGFTAQNFNKYKITAALPDVQTGTEIGCFISLHAAVPNNSYGTFIDPEIDLV